MGQKLEKRVAILESDLAQLRKSLAPHKAKPWWEQIAGKFANDPVYDHAMRLGREYRESLRPPAKQKLKNQAQLKNDRA